MECGQVKNKKLITTPNPEWFNNGKYFVTLNFMSY